MSGFVLNFNLTGLKIFAMDKVYSDVIVLMFGYEDNKGGHLYYLVVISFPFSAERFSFKISAVIFKNVKRGNKPSGRKFIRVYKF